MENTKSPTIGHGKICYIEIPATDIDTSASFYQTVSGWHVRKRSDGSVAFDDGVGEVSGTWILGIPPATSGLRISIMVDDAVATLEAITANGGKILQPIGMHFPEITAQFSDVAGNIWGIYQERG
jgi:predicted enzyme related to lactoylglutathione lyase